MNYIGPDLGYRQYSGQEERQDQEEGHHFTNNYYGEARGDYEELVVLYFYHQIVRKWRGSVWRGREREIV